MIHNNHDKMPNFVFRIMSGIIFLQELWPQRIDMRVAGFGIQKGQTVVDYGCGPGRYTFRFAKQVGEQGKVYAVDVHELAIEAVKQKMQTRGVANVIPILVQGYQTGIPRHSVNIVLALDMFFLVENPATLLAEIHRILRPDGLLILDDGHNSRENTLKKD